MQQQVQFCYHKLLPPRSSRKTSRGTAAVCRLCSASARCSCTITMPAPPMLTVKPSGLLRGHWTRDGTIYANYRWSGKLSKMARCCILIWILERRKFVMQSEIICFLRLNRDCSDWRKIKQVKTKEDTQRSLIREKWMLFFHDLFKIWRLIWIRLICI